MARYTKQDKPKRLVYTEEFDIRGEAVKRERKIKKLGHDEKHRTVGRARLSLQILKH